MVEEIISQKFRLENIDETKNCFLEEKNKMNRWIDSTKKVVQL